MTGPARSPLVSAWAARGTRRRLCGREIFTVDLAPEGAATAEPLLVLHGFPSSSFDFHPVADGLRQHRRVVLFDMCGYGLSEKPDIAYTVDLQADIAVALVGELGLSEVALLTHDFGDTVGGELLARQAEGSWPAEVTRRVLTNGSIYIEMAQLSAGQQWLLSLPDRQLDPAATPDAPALALSLAATLAPDAVVADEELAAMAELVLVGGGASLLPRTIRYIEERRRRQGRFTGAIERHPAPLAVVWGTADPIAVTAMAERLQAARPGTPVVLLEEAGHYPMVESPRRFLAAVEEGLR